MIEINKGKILNLSLLYLELPIALFFLFWCKWYISIAGILIIGYIHFFQSKANFKKTNNTIKINKKYLFLVLFIILIWCILGGQGNLYYQSSDWGCRNAIYKKMIFGTAPYYFEDGSFLSYYIGHWIVPSTISKIFIFLGLSKSIVWHIGNIILLLWTALGISLSFFLVAFYTKADKTFKIFLVLLIFILFSGLDVIGLLIRNTGFSNHIEPWNIYYQFSSQTTQLFWVFNQAIPVWVGTLLFLQTDHIKFDVFIGALLILFSPLPIFGCFALILFKILFNYILKKDITRLFKEGFSIVNILSLVIALPLFLFIFSNTRSSGTAGVLFNLNIGGDSWYNWFMLIVFLIVEVYIYLLFVYKNNKKNYLFYAITITLPFIAAFRFGTSNDFEMRASIPLLTCLMLLVIKEVLGNIEYKDKRLIIQRRIVPLIFCLLIGAVTPFVEFYRGYSEVRTNHKINLTDESVTLHKDSINFVSPNYKDTKFAKYIGK